MKVAATAVATVLLFAVPAFAADESNPSNANSSEMKAPSSGPGVKGAPGSTNGPALKSQDNSSGASSSDSNAASSGASSGEQGTGAQPSQDAKGVEGAPGSTNGPAVKQPDDSNTSK